MSMREIDTVILKGTIVTATGTVQAAVAIDGGKIVAVGPPDALPPARQTIDATGRYVLPGPIDVHTHFGRYDDWRIGPQAAAYGGITTVVNFIASRPGERLPEAVARVRAEAERDSVLDFGFHLILRNAPGDLAAIEEVVEAGVTSFKMFMCYKGWGAIYCPDSFILQAMETIGGAGGLCQLHCESGDVIDYLEQRSIREEKVGPQHFLETRPDWTEEEATNRGIAMAGMTGCPLYVVHLSAHLALERIKQAQAAGQRVWTETCPQYLLLSDGEMERWGPFAKIGPPLRSADGFNQEAMWRGARDGYVACVASDHAPFIKEDKESGWRNIFVDAAGKTIPFGAPSVETMVPLMFSEGVVKRGLPVSWLARVLSENPARIFGLYPRKGVIQPGADADLLIIDPGRKATIRAGEQHVTAGYTLYEGWEVAGWPVLSLSRGRLLLNEGRIEAQPGSGRYLRRSGPAPPIGGRIA